MNKGIIMEQHPRFTIVMTNDGLFEKAYPIKNAPIGSETYYQPMEQKKTLSFLTNVRRFVAVPASILSVVALIMLLALPVYFATNTSKTYAYVNIDINPSVKMEINKELQVNSISSLNDDGSLLIDHLSNLKGESLEEALKKIMQESESSGLTEHGKNMIIGINYADGKNKEAISIDNLNLSSDWGVVALTITEDVRKTAEEKHMSMNKVMLEKVDGDPDKISHLDTKDKEIIHSFYNREHQEKNDQDSSKLKKDKQLLDKKQNTTPQKVESDKPEAEESTKPKNKSQEKANETSTQSKNQQNKQSTNKEKKAHSKKKKQEKHKNHQPPGQQKKQEKHKNHQPPGQNKKQEKHKNHQPPGQQKKQEKHKNHQPPGQKKKQDKHKNHQPPGQQKKQEKHKNHQPPGQRK